MKQNLFIFITIISSYLQANWWFEIVPLQKLLQENPMIQYRKCFRETAFSYKEFPLSFNQQTQPSHGFFQETFVLTIPNGKVQSYGLVTINNQFIQELIWKNLEHNLVYLEKLNETKLVKIHGRIAVIGQSSYHNYFHWLTEVLCRLALLELAGIEYDYLYVPQNSSFMKETLSLWGINPEKIIAPYANTYIQADLLIVPSMVSNVSFGFAPFSCYVQPHLIKYVKDKLLSGAKKRNINTKHLSNRVFVSRKDAHQRHVINEDEVFKLFQAHKFVRYELENLSVTEQILLFHNAEIIVSPQGTGLANSIFCTQKAKIIELLQALNDSTFWYLSQNLNLNYFVVQTTQFIFDYMTAWQSDTNIPLSLIENMMSDLNISKI
jgi:hypothetical protein